MTKIPEYCEVFSHECFGLVDINHQLYWIDVQLKTISRVAIPANSPSLVEYPKPVSVSPTKLGTVSSMERKDI